MVFNIQIHEVVRTVFRTLFYLVFLPMTAMPASGLEVCLLAKPDGAVDTLPSLRHSGVLCVSLPQLCSSLGITLHRDSVSGFCTISRGGTEVVLVNNNPFYRMRDSVVQLHCPPVASEGTMYLRMADAAAIAGHLIGRPVVLSGSAPGVVATGKKTPSLAKAVSSGPAAAANAKTETRPVPKITGQPISIGTMTRQKDDQQLIRTVVIDPGHGGKDPGAIGPTGLKEKDVVLAIALALRDALAQKAPELKIFMTRETDVFIPLRQRTQFANEKQADLFISIHANSIAGNKKRKSEIKGYKIYFLSQAKNEEDKLAAMIENSVIELEDNRDGGNDLQNILIDMANNEFLTESQDIAIMIAETFGKSLDKVSAQQQGVGQANFWVLNGAYMPSVLVETCFISNPDEEKLIATEKFQKKAGAVLSDAIIQFRKKYEAGL